MQAPKNSRRLCSSVVALGGPYRVPAAAMPRVKTVRRRLALRTASRKMSKMSTCEANKSVRNSWLKAKSEYSLFGGKYGASSQSCPDSPTRRVIMRKSGTGSKQKRSKYSVQLSAATNLITAYVRSPKASAKTLGGFWPSIAARCARVPFPQTKPEIQKGSIRWRNSPGYTCMNAGSTGLRRSRGHRSPLTNGAKL